MKPLRRKKTCEVTHDPITGQERILELTQEEDFLSDHGSVDSAGLHQRYFRDCGCDGPIGGRCFECGAISCKSCHGRCHNCQKPICLAHSKFLGTNSQERVRLCGCCFEKITRKQNWTKIHKFILSIFVEGDKDG